MNQPPLPRLPDIEGWGAIPIRPSNEPLVSLTGRSDRILVRSQYFLQGIPGAIDDVLLRETPAELLLRAADRLPHGYKLVLYDGYRPIAVQTSLYRMFHERLRREHPALDEEALAHLTAQYVSLPSVASDRPSPHLTGGSIDLTLADEQGIELPMGTPFDDFTERSHTAYFEAAPTLESEAERVRDNRRLLYAVMAEAGFTNYPNEWWHYDYGNQFWARCSGQAEAIYGPVLSNAEETQHDRN